MKKIKVICPNCGATSKVLPKAIGYSWGIDRVKCSQCFHERNIFVNLQHYENPVMKLIKAIKAILHSLWCIICPDWYKEIWSKERED